MGWSWVHEGENQELIEQGFVAHVTLGFSVYNRKHSK